MNTHLPRVPLPSLNELSRVCTGCMLSQGRHCKCRAAAQAAPTAHATHMATAQPVRLSRMLNKVLGWPSPTV